MLPDAAFPHRYGRFFCIEHGHILAAAGGMGIDVGDLPGQRLSMSSPDAGLRGDAGQIDMLLRRTNDSLHNGMGSGGNGFDLDEPAFAGSTAIVARELRHGIAGVGVLILHHPDTGLNFTSITYSALAMQFSSMETHLCMTTGVPAGRLQWPAHYSPGGCWRLKAGADLDGGIYADGNGNGQRAAQLCGTLCHGADVAGTGHQENRELVLALDAHPVDGDIAAAGIRMGGVAHAHGDIRACILGGIGGGRDQLVKIKIGIGDPVNDLPDRGAGSSVTTGSMGFWAQRHSNFPRSSLVVPNRAATRWRLAKRPMSTRASGCPLILFKDHSGPVNFGGGA